MLTQLSLRLRVLLLFTGLGALALIMAGLGLIVLAKGAALSDPDPLIQGAMIAGFGILAGVVGMWFLFDLHLAQPLERLAGALRTGRAPDDATARYLADIGPAACDAALARSRADQALADAIQAHADEQQAEKSSLEAILADFGAGVVMTDLHGRVIFYNASASGFLPGLALDRSLDRHLHSGALNAAKIRLQAGADATDLSCLTTQGARLSGRLRSMPNGQLLILRDRHVERPAPRATLEALRRHASTLVPMLGALDGPIPDALAHAIMAEGQGLADTTRELSRILASDGPAGTATLTEITAGLSPATSLPSLLFQADAGQMNALLVSLDYQLRGQGYDPQVTLHRDQGDMRIALEWNGPAIPIDLLDRWLTQPPDMTRPDDTGAEILAAHGTGIWPETDGRVARLVMPMVVVNQTAQNSGVIYDFALAAKGVASTRLADLTCVVFDTETTGLGDHDAILQIAGLRLARGRLTGERFETLVNPERPIPVASTRIHGITDAMVADAPDLTTALTAFRHFCDDDVLIAHNAPFDMGFLRRAAAETGAHFNNRILDTVLLSAMVWGQSEVHSLDALTERLGIIIPPEDRHTAMGDTIATAQAFLQLVPALRAKGIERFEHAVQHARRHRRLIEDANSA
jgi:DNA polymerase-3 subunit epsilon